MMNVYVGTSGWSYSWNSGGSFDWYVANSGLNAVELNASFYKFPYPNQIKHWASIGYKFVWSIKVNRIITHQYMLSRGSYAILRKFIDLFSPLEKSIKFYRMLRRKSWYNYNYSKKELQGMFMKIKALKPRNASIFNNNHDMLSNAKLAMRLVK
ncbi:MAG: DUF72 domain-containing protein [Candidatus Micrarchaeia archaeon]